MPSVSEGTICADCATSTSELLEIRNRYLCHQCLTKYVVTKVVKRMETYSFKRQVGDHPRRLLLPISGGMASLALLHVLDVRVKAQIEKRGRPAFDLILVHLVTDEHRENVDAWKQAVSVQFPNHEFLPLFELQDVVRYDENIEQDLKELGINRIDDEDDTAFLSRLFASTRTVTARSDLHDVLLQRLLVALAKKYNCESILWGHSDSRLAAKVLAEVGKGRGGSVPNMIADGPTSWNVNFNYPLRELYKSELELYLQYQDDDLMHCLLRNETKPVIPIATRNTSIDALLIGYITSQGAKYPSIMANVVRTAGKLEAVQPTNGQGCKLCASLVVDLTGGVLCYGCTRMKQDVKF